MVIFCHFQGVLCHLYASPSMLAGRVLAMEMTAPAEPLPYVKNKAWGLHVVRSLPMENTPPTGRELQTVFTAAA
jgi:hypothetical protein